MVCVECVEGDPLYSLDRSVPAKTIHGNTENRLQEDQHRLPAKMHLDGSQGRFGQTYGPTGPTLAPLATAFLRVTAWWALMLVHRCRGLVGLFGLSGGLCYAGRDLLRLYLCGGGNSRWRASPHHARRKVGS